ncbi:hypothetical protein [Thermoactinospora rubra]|uniref:hypothetical protein n=1 Tax=Thermoactinospora rubra TaxID=1088767 RepID=UPI00117E5DCC|nr:hypothetical protein [Thermoactinospora rubra]
MGNGARHGLGVVAGLVLAPVTYAGLCFGVARVARGLAEGYLPWIGLSALVATGVALGLMAGSRLSPLASLLPGLAFLGAGALPHVSVVTGTPYPGVERFLAGDLRAGHDTLAGSGALLVIGILLLAASLPPSRWRGRAKAAYGGPPPHSGQGGGDWQRGDWQAGEWQGGGQQPHQPYQPEPEDTTRPMRRE